MLEIAVLLRQLDLWVRLAVHVHAQLEEVDALAPLDHLVVELGTDEGTLDVVRVVASAVGLLVGKKEVVQVVVGLGAAVFKRAALGFYHEDDEDEVADHVRDRDGHHGRVLRVVLHQHEEGDHLDQKVQAPEELVGVPLFRQPPAVLKHHQEAAEEPGHALYRIKYDKVVVFALVDPARMLGTRLLPPAYEHIDEEGKAHERRYRKLELEVERVDDAPLANIADPAVAHRSEDEKEDAWDDLHAELHHAKRHVVLRVANRRPI